MRALWLLMAQEWRLMRVKDWAPRPHQAFAVGTQDHPACKTLELKQRILAARMRAQGRSLSAGKAYVPVLTKPAEPPVTPPMAAKVVPIRGKKR